MTYLFTVPHFAFILFTFSLTISPAKAVDLKPCDTFRTGIIQAISKRIEENRFETSRGLDLYDQFLGDEFRQELGKLNSKSNWIDMGSGDGRAIYEYATGQHPYDQKKLKRMSLELKEIINRTPEQKAHVTGVSFAMPKNIVQNSKLVDYKHGKFFEQIPLNEFKKTDLITDFYGVFSYTDNVSEVLDRYLKLLNKDGSAFLYGDWYSTQIILPNQESISLVQWLSQIKGIKVEIIKNVDYTEQNIVAALKITKTTGEQKIVIPKLKILEISDEGPPKRKFTTAD